MVQNPKYSICFVLDKSNMFRCGVDNKYLKPLHIIWSKLPHLWGKHNTLHIDDLERNFQFNPRNGILIEPFYRKGSKKKASKKSSSHQSSASSSTSSTAQLPQLGGVYDTDCSVGGDDVSPSTSSNSTGTVFAMSTSPGGNVLGEESSDDVELLLLAR